MDVDVDDAVRSSRMGIVAMYKPPMFVIKITMTDCSRGWGL